MMPSCIRDLLLQVWTSESGRENPGVNSLWIPRVIDDGVCAHRNRGGEELK